ncbi:MAG: GNAT family N-acetyltransferase [Alphaproteobacteria bacterium]|nr:GNAT family N-acetyltransferase [Alphaproteobacteria bacterium]
MDFEKHIYCEDFALVKLAPTDENADALLREIDENREFLGRFLDWVDAYTNIEKTKANIAKSYPIDICSYFIIVDEKIAGKIGFVDVDDNMGEISYWLTREYTGRGIMTRALNLMTDIGFNKMGLNRIQLTLDVDNTGSDAVARRCGFKLDGVLRQYFLLRGAPRDMKMYSKLKTDE